MKNLMLAAVAALALIGTPALAQTVTLGLEKEVSKAERDSVRMEVAKPIGPVTATLELKSQLAKDGIAGKSELVAGVRYDSPIVFWGVTPFVRGELGVTTEGSNRSFVGAEVGAFGEIDGPYSWEAAYRVRDPSGGKNLDRLRGTVFYTVNEQLKVGGSVMVWDEKNVKTTGFGVDLVRKF
jgi:hypothetical protein